MEMESSILPLSLMTPPPSRKTVTVDEALSLMTPSSSGCGVRVLEPMFPTPLPYPYLTPSQTPATEHLQNREVVDIIGEFYYFGPLEMAQKILSYLEPADLVK